MPNLTSATASSILQLIFNATTWAGIAQNATSSPLGNYYLSLHNADPGASGNQSTNETAYTNYARIIAARTGSGWTISGSSPVQVANAAVETFAQCGATGDTLTHWGIGELATGAGTLLMSGPIGPGPVASFTATLASPGVFTIPGSSLAVNNRISFYGNAAGTLPTGVTEGVVYYVGTASGTAITLSTTASNGSPVNTTGAGAGYSIVSSPLVVSNGVTPSFASAALVAYLS